MSELGKEVLSKVSGMLAREGLEAVVAMSPENSAYVAGFLVPSMKIIRSRLVMCVIASSGDSCQVVADMEESYTKATTSLARVRAYNEFTETPMIALAEVLKGMGLAEARIALELDYISADAFQELVKLLPKAKFVAAIPFFSKCRAIKTPTEIQTLRALGKIADGAHKAVAEKARPGISERDIALILYDSIFRNGADEVTQLCIGSGERSTFANPYATERCLMNGDVMRIDIYAKLHNYLSDCARTYVAGKLTAFERDMWDKMLETRQACLDMVKPGAHTSEIYKKFNALFTSYGLKPINFVGHGLGLTLHEDPYVGRYGDWVLEQGMVLCIEPYVVFPEKNSGFQVEDEILVTPSGFELLTGFDGPPPLYSLG